MFHTCWRKAQEQQEICVAVLHAWANFLLESTARNVMFMGIPSLAVLHYALTQNPPQHSLYSLKGYILIPPGAYPERILCPSHLHMTQAVCLSPQLTSQHLALLAIAADLHAEAPLLCCCYQVAMTFLGSLFI
eukprot:1158705-Pelagomonas_calceolata.AAC.19